MRVDARGDPPAAAGERQGVWANVFRDTHGILPGRDRHPSLPPSFLSELALSKPCLLSKCLEYFEKVVEAVNFIHTKGVTHYDVKCDNVLLTEEGDVRLVDFGEASVRPGWDAQNVYNTRDRGTECIKSPEMLTVCHAEDGDRPQYDRRRKQAQMRRVMFGR